MVSSLSNLKSDIRPIRNRRTVSPAEASRLIQSGATIAVDWLGDALAAAMENDFRTGNGPDDLTVVYATATDSGRNHGLNILAREGLVRRIVGGNWHPVPRLHALASTNRVEAYSLPVGVIRRLFRDIADGLPGHLSRSGLGTSVDPRNGGGRLNQRTVDQLVRLVRPAGDEALLFRGFPIDIATVGVSFMAGSAAIVMSHDAHTIARAARKCGGVVIAQTNRVGTLDAVPPGHVEAPDTLVDVIVNADGRDRTWETLSPIMPAPTPHRRLTF
jgi:propionate CoA-transferase